jgi:hypothetical protein
MCLEVGVRPDVPDCIVQVVKNEMSLESTQYLLHTLPCRVHIKCQYAEECPHGSNAQRVYTQGLAIK